MKYNFDNWIDRKDTMSQKWDAQETNFPDNPGALPMWVADMDFPCPGPIVDAVVKRAAHPCFHQTGGGGNYSAPCILSFPGSGRK